jgi:hypothetical protein
LPSLPLEGGPARGLLAHIPTHSSLNRHNNRRRPPPAPAPRGSSNCPHHPLKPQPTDRSSDQSHPPPRTRSNNPRKRRSRPIMKIGGISSTAPDGTQEQPIAVCSDIVAAVSPSDTQALAVELMRHQAVRQLPGGEDGHPVGLVTLATSPWNANPASALGTIHAAAPTTEPCGTVAPTHARSTPVLPGGPLRLGSLWATPSGPGCRAGPGGWLLPRCGRLGCRDCGEACLRTPPGGRRPGE